MSYGSYSLGSAALSGASASKGTLFAPSDSLARGVHRRSMEYIGGASFFQVESRSENEATDSIKTVRIYSHNDPGETPQLQTSTSADNFYSQSIVGAARFIVVDLELIAPWPTSPSVIGVTITGSEYFQ